MKHLFDSCRARVRCRRGVGEYLEVKRGLRQGYLMSSWLFIGSFDKMLRQANEETSGKGVKVSDEWKW